jgi:hypothetical protein
MRLVTRFASHHQFFGDRSFEEQFKTLVNSTAESVWCSRDKNTGTVGPNWNPGFGPDGENNSYSGGTWPLVFQTAALDALNAAQAIEGAG